MKKFLSALSLASVLAGVGVSTFGCDMSSNTVAVSPEELAKGGVYVAYNNKQGCTGCEQIKKGDLILELDGSPVASRADVRLSKLASSNPVKLKLWRPIKDNPAGQELEVTITATPHDKLPPLEGAPPMFTVGAQKLDKAPTWARKTLFGHVSLATMLVNANGGISDGRQLLGKKHMLLFWDWGTREEQAQAAEMLKVLQLAQADLNAAGVDILFTQIQFPSNDRQRPMNDGQLRDFMKTHGSDDQPPLPLYRFPNSTEYNKAREIGLEGSTTYIEYLRAPPSIVLLDEGGVIRWHSEGIASMPPDAKAATPTQYTIIEAIKFAKNDL